MFNPFDPSEGVPTIDVVSVEPVALHKQGYSMSLGQRQLIADFIAQVYESDLVTAVDRICGKMSTAQQANWDLHVKTAASNWANQRNAGLDVSDRQVESGVYFANLLLGLTQHSDDAVNARLRAVPHAIRQNLANAFMTSDSQGQYNRARTRLVGMVPGIVGQRQLNPEDSELFQAEGIIAPAGDKEEAF
jgi:hypothetical protein